MKVFFGLLTVVILAISCGKTALNAEVGTPFKMTSVQSVNISNTDIKLNGFKVIEDSRCPKNTTCFWEGQVVAEFDMDGEPLKFNSYKPLDTLGYTFQIKSVTPVKEEGVDIPLANYILEILVIK